MVTSKKKPSRKKDKSHEDMTLEQYSELFDQIHRFTTSIASIDEKIIAQNATVLEAKAKLDDAREKLRELETSRDGAKHSLYRFLNPQTGEIFPLFDTMEVADEEVHGKNSCEWRREPIASLKLSLPAITALTSVDIVMVGQLQDRVLANPDYWFESVPPLNNGTASAIVDRLNDFIFERTAK